jgi:hypothetical protein
MDKMTNLLIIEVIRIMPIEELIINKEVQLAMNLMGLAMLTIVGVATLSHRIKEAKNNQSE